MEKEKDLFPNRKTKFMGSNKADRSQNTMPLAAELGGISCW